MSSASARCAACCRTSRAASCSPRSASVSPRRSSATAACGPGAGAVVLGHRAAQPGLGLVVAPEQAGEAPDVVLVGAEAADRAGDEREQPRVRLEQRVQRRARLAVAHEHGGVGQDAGAVPVGVHRQGAAAVAGELGDQPARVLRRPGLGVDQRQVDEPLRGGGRGRGALDEPRAVHLADAPLGVEADAARWIPTKSGAFGSSAWRPSASARSAELVGLVPAAGQQRERGAPQRHVPAEVRQGDGVGEGLVGVDLRRRLPRRGRARAGRPRASCAPAAPPRDRRPPRRRRSCRRRRPAARRRGAGTTARRGGRSARPRARRRSSARRARSTASGAELAGARGVRVVQLDGQPGEQPRGRRRIAGRRGRERLLEQAHGGRDRRRR